jgi:streptomycin 6-kinase
MPRINKGGWLAIDSRQVSGDNSYRANSGDNSAVLSNVLPDTDNSQVTY